MSPELLEIYRDLHRHPELLMQEQRTAGIAADYIGRLGYAVTGVAGVLRNGDGPTVMLRADRDASPVTAPLARAPSGRRYGAGSGRAAGVSAGSACSTQLRSRPCCLAA